MSVVQGIGLHRPSREGDMSRSGGRHTRPKHKRRLARGPDVVQNHDGGVTLAQASASTFGASEPLAQRALGVEQAHERQRCTPGDGHRSSLIAGGPAHRGGNAVERVDVAIVTPLAIAGPWPAQSSIDILRQIHAALLLGNRPDATLLTCFHGRHRGPRGRRTGGTGFRPALGQPAQRPWNDGEQNRHPGLKAEAIFDQYSGLS
jgi:hypothetical protein